MLDNGVLRLLGAGTASLGTDIHKDKPAFVESGLCKQASISGGGRPPPDRLLAVCLYSRRHGCLLICSFPGTFMRTLLTNATLIDCVHPQPIQGATVLIEDGRIREIRNDGNQIDAGDALEINLGGGYLMPGLWDVHIHPDYHSLSDM